MEGALSWPGFMPGDRAERIGLTASVAGHAGVLLFALVAGFFSRPDLSLPVTMTEVSVITSDQFAALQARAPTAPTESPAVPSAPEAKPAGANAPKPVEEAGPAAPPPKPEETPSPDAAPDVTALTPPAPQVSPTDPVIETPPVEVPSDTVLETISPKPRPTDAPRIAPEPSDAPAPDAAPADQVVQETAPVPAETPVPDKPVEAQAPEAATTQTPVEKDVAAVTQSSAPQASARPKARPEKPKPAAQPQTAVAAAPAPQEAAAPDATDQAALDAALAAELSGDASSEPAPGTGVAASGPPLTSGEIDAMRIAVKKCWVVDNGGQMANVIVTVGFDMSPDGRVVDGSVRMLDATGGNDVAIRTAFEAASRAIRRCQGQGYPLPADKYEYWKRTEIVFDPSKMRLR